MNSMNPIGPPIPLLMQSLGVTSPKGRQAAEAALTKFHTEHPNMTNRMAVEELVAAILPYPPEFHARLLAECISHVMMAVQATTNLMVQVRVAGQDVAAINARRTGYMLDLLDHLEAQAFAIRDQCIEREAQGYPEWDYTKAHEPAKPLDLGGLLEGIDLSWFENEEQQEQNA